MRIWLLKLVAKWLATLGIFIPHHALLCAHGHTPASSPTNCEQVRF